MEQYSYDKIRYTPDHIAFTMRLAGITHSPNTILDVGCGDGIWTNELSKYYNIATGIDINEEGIAVAKYRYPHIHFEQCSLYDYHHKHDTVFSRCCGLHKSDIDTPEFQRSIEKMVSLCNKEFIYIEYSKFPDLDLSYWAYKDPKQAEQYLSKFGEIVHSVFEKHYLCIKVKI